LGLCTTGLLFEDLKKVEFRVGRTFLKKLDFFSIITSFSKNPPLWKKVFLQKLDNKKGASNSFLIFETDKKFEF
jgi:hypothetical protein